MENKVVDIQLLNVEDHGANVLVNYTKLYGNGTKKVCRTHVRDLGRYYKFFTAKPIVAAECLGKVYLGMIKNDCRILFHVKLNDGSAQLIQVREGSNESLKRFQLSVDTANGNIQIPAPPATQGSTKPAQPYQLGKNELPQGRYLIGRDVPAGTYDFFVVYGHGGIFRMGKYDGNNNIISDTSTFYWVGLKEDYEQRELVHVLCKEGYTIELTGNVIIKIAKSQKVHIEL